jgi:hypothetical protein
MTHKFLKISLNLTAARKQHAVFEVRIWCEMRYGIIVPNRAGAPFRTTCFHEFVILGSALNIELYPDWGMVAGVYLATHPSVYTAAHKSVRHFR